MRLLKNDFIAVDLDGNAQVEQVIQGGMRLLAAKSVLPYIRYIGMNITPNKLRVTGGSARKK